MTRQFYSDPGFGVVDATTVFTDSKYEVGPPKRMKLSEFIAELQQVLKDEGDLLVVDGESIGDEEFEERKLRPEAQREDGLVI